MENNNEKNNSKIISAIIVAGLIIAGAILLKDAKPPAPANPYLGIEIRPITEEDHIVGDKNAKIIVVEYSDTECPYCKVFHSIMHQLVANNKGDVAWVYRHFPIAGLHERAYHEAVATECAWEAGGNDVFWQYLDEVYVRTKSNDGLEVSELDKIAVDLNIDQTTFSQCLTAEKYGPKVDADIAEGQSAGVEGTPTSFILKDGKIVNMIVGAQPLANMQKEINKLK